MKKLTMLFFNILFSLIGITCATDLKVVPAQESDSFWASSKTIFEKEEGSNLRILDINVWEWDGSKEEIPDVWIEAGADCTNETRSKGFARVAYAYLPDVISLQEYSPEMHEQLYPKLEDLGYQISFLPDSANFTPVFYNKNTVELIETSYFEHDKPYNNRRTKSYTTAVMRLKENNETFIVINTHLWWKNESVTKGSDQARVRQLDNIMEEGKRLVKKYKCPIFLMGDFNCQLPDEPLQNALKAGYRPAWEIATVFGDRRCGHHQCSAKGFSRKENKPNDGNGCIDHFLIYDPKGASEVKVFKREYAEFTVRLTDHYPNFADIRLGR